MEPNQGVVAGDLRVLIVRTKEQYWQMSLAALLEELLVGAGWKVTVSPADAEQVIAEKWFARRRDAERARAQVVREATERGIDSSNVAEIRHLLDT